MIRLDAVVSQLLDVLIQDICLCVSIIQVDRTILDTAKHIIPYGVPEKNFRLAVTDTLKIKMTPVSTITLLWFKVK